MGEPPNDVFGGSSAAVGSKNWTDICATEQRIALCKSSILWYQQSLSFRALSTQGFISINSRRSTLCMIRAGHSPSVFRARAPRLSSRSMHSPNRLPITCIEKARFRIYHRIKVKGPANPLPPDDVLYSTDRWRACRIIYATKRSTAPMAYISAAR
jgi:hypothetical protein